jgi:quercetin dioxygenase-like cupin family protein
MQYLELGQITERELVPGFCVRLVHTDHLTLAFWSVEQGAVLPQHAHPHEQVTTLQEGQLELTVEGETKTLLPGSVVIIPPNVPHNGRAITGCRIIDAFYPPRDDYR